MINKKPVVLVIDDEESMRDSCSLILSKDGFEAHTAENGFEGLEKIKKINPDLALIDLKMPGISGFEVLEKAQEVDPQLISIVITGYTTIESAVEAMKKGAYDFLPKPFTPDELRIIIRRALEKRKLVEEAEILRLEKKRMEENFITLVSHQLRSPLVAIVQYFEVILGGMAGKVEPKQKEMLEKVKIRSEALLELINDWLDIARMNGSQLVDKLKPMPISPCLLKLVEFMQPSAEENHVTMNILPPEGSDTVLGDEETLEQVFSNLISNAIKYNKPQGTVTIAVQERPEFVIVEVRDTGIGIPEEHLPYIFDQFYRVKRSEDQKAKGSGLGLTIAKKIIEAHDGRVEVTSQVGQGSVFRVYLSKP